MVARQDRRVCEQKFDTKSKIMIHQSILKNFMPIECICLGWVSIVSFVIQLREEDRLD